MPVSEKRLAANRANAGKSTGPKSPEGKRISSRNGARKSDLARYLLLDGESAARFDAVLRAYRDEYQPSTPTEHDFIEDMVVARWNQSRARILHTAAINYEIRHRIQSATDEAYAGEDACTRAMLALRGGNSSSHVELLARDQARYERQYRHALRALTRFRREKLLLRQNTTQLEDNKGPVL